MYSEITEAIKSSEIWLAGREMYSYKEPGEGYLNWIRDVWTSRGESLDFTDKFLIDIYKDTSPDITLMKSAQAGATEYAVSQAMWLPDQYAENSIYFFPTSGTASDLVQERVDDPLNNSAYLRRVSGRARRVMGKHADKTSLKRMSKGFVYFRGTNNPTQITSVPADAVFVDEVDRMPQAHLSYIPKRLLNSTRKWQRWLSTPTLPDYGIHKRFLETDQLHYYVKCNHCGHEQNIDFFQNVKWEMNGKHIVNERIVCSKCEGILKPWELEGHWIAYEPENTKRGYHLSKLYSHRVNLKGVIEASLRTSDFEIEQFYNQDLGLPYQPKGGRITEETLFACKRDHKKGYYDKNANHYMGVDVGAVLHVIVQNSKNEIVFIDSVKDFEDLDRIMYDFNINFAVIDALPETRESQRFVTKYRGRAALCYYSGLSEVKDDQWFKYDDDGKVNTDRTLSLDMYSARFKNQDIFLPSSLESEVEFIAHMKSLTRVKKESRQVVKAEYAQIGPDHFYHAGNYSNIARGIFEDIAEPEVFIL